MASRYQHHHHRHRPHGGYNHSRFLFFSPAIPATVTLRKYHSQYLAEPAVSSCLIWIEFSQHKNGYEPSHLPKQKHRFFTEGNKSNAGQISCCFKERGCISARLINMQNIRALLATRIFPLLHILQMCTNIIFFFLFTTPIGKKKQILCKHNHILMKRTGIPSPKLHCMILILCRNIVKPKRYS